MSNSCRLIGIALAVSLVGGLIVTSRCVVLDVDNAQGADKEWRKANIGFVVWTGVLAI